MNRIFSKPNLPGIFIIIIFLSGTIQLYPQNKRIFHPFNGTSVFSLGSGASLGKTDYADTKFDFVWRSKYEFFFSTYTNHFIGLNLFGGSGFLAGSESDKNPPEIRTDLYYLGGGIIYGYKIDELLYPYFSAGLLHLWFDPRSVNDQRLINNANAVYDRTEVNAFGELGLRYMFTRDWTINLSGGVYSHWNDYLDDYKAGKNNDIYFAFYLGFSYVLNSQWDEDKDGVADNSDLCPSTPEGISVDEHGCPSDSDRDGVADYMDLCPSTPYGVKVNDNGCPVDTDKDGVPDFADRCSSTPTGVRVDRFGCPLDSDGDSVPDYLDRCPNTPNGERVDRNGCPLDSDRDGVPDFADKCPDTRPDRKVDKEGCEVIPEKFILSASTYFETGKSILLPEAYSELNKVVEVMLQNPNTIWRIEGHTDNTGSTEFNHLLSLNRATSVFNYIISRGVDKNRIEVIGLGEDFPVADNDTEQGRLLNRRVVIIRIR
ncbi:MAG: OmpA family protein [Ignavibacteriaceae bacterium]